MSNTGRIKPADIRPPQTKAEAVAALALAKSRLEGAERSLADGKPQSFSTREAFEHWQGRVTYAIALWREKVTELEYLLARFESDANPIVTEALQHARALKRELHHVIATVRDLARDAALPPSLREYISKLEATLPESQQ